MKYEKKKLIPYNFLKIRYKDWKGDGMGTGPENGTVKSAHSYVFRGQHISVNSKNRKRI